MAECICNYATLILCNGIFSSNRGNLFPCVSKRPKLQDQLQSVHFSFYCTIRTPATVAPKCLGQWYANETSKIKQSERITLTFDASFVYHCLY